jgi:hypothetical integral membrane protein (TIGR02206 family)
MADAVMASERFQAFTGQHLVLIGIFLVGCVVVALVGRAQRGTATEERFRRVFAVVIPVFTVPTQLAQMRPSDWDINTSLPLQLCDLTWIAAMYALWTCRPWAVALTYYWGLTLTTQAILTPSLGQQFPDPRFFGYWGMHFLDVWAAVCLTWGLRRTPTWHGYRVAVVATSVWAVVVAAFNNVAGTNYGYLNAKPTSGSLLDLLGPWPMYVAAEIAIVLAGWALITWPWTVGRSSTTASVPRPRQRN